MPRLRGKLFQTARRLPLLVLLPLLMSAGFDQAQEPLDPLPPPSQSGRVPFSHGPEANQDQAMIHIQEQALRKRSIDRQKRIVADSDKLVQMARQLNGEVESGRSDGLAAIAKQAEEMEKLARSVKERMKAE